MVMNNPISIIMQAAGKVKEYFVPVESMTILCPFVCWVLFYIGMPSETAFYSMISATILSHIIRLWCLKKHYPVVSIREYLYGFMLPAFVTTIIIFIAIYLIHILSISVIIKFLIQILAVCILSVICVVAFGLSQYERQSLRNIINKIRKK